ncbi:MAG: hypothetical protein QXY26_08455 [Ignisphaera sp.]
MNRMKMIKLVHFDKESVEDVPVERIVAQLRREGDIIVVDFDDMFRFEKDFAYPGLTEVDEEKKEFKHVFKRYIGTGKPRIYPVFDVVERGADYVVVRRHDGVLFKIAHAFPTEILLNIYNNPGIALWDLIAIELAISAKEISDFTEEDAKTGIYLVVDAVGFFTYILELTRLEF